MTVQQDDPWHWKRATVATIVAPTFVGIVSGIAISTIAKMLLFTGLADITQFGGAEFSPALSDIQNFRSARVYMMAGLVFGAPVMLLLGMPMTYLISRYVPGHKKMAYILIPFAAFALFFYRNGVSPPFDLSDLLTTLYYLFLPAGSGWMIYNIVHRGGVKKTIRSIFRGFWDVKAA